MAKISDFHNTNFMSNTIECSRCGCITDSDLCSNCTYLEEKEKYEERFYMFLYDFINRNRSRPKNHFTDKEIMRAKVAFKTYEDDEEEIHECIRWRD